MLGTGNAQATECYNTCFVLSDGGRHLLVDGGGGSGLLRQLKRAGLRWMDMREIFVTHKHVDHLLGIVWMVRMFCQGINRAQCEGGAVIYGHDEVIGVIESMSRMLFPEKETRHIGPSLRLVTVQDGEETELIGRRTSFFDIRSTKAKQYGFSMDAGGKRLTCCGDEPYNECERPWAQGADWLMHEAFCLHSQADIFKPYEKNHSTVKDACELAQRLGVKNLLLCHTEDRSIQDRKALYTAEGRQFFQGSLFVPDDLETLEI